MRLDARTLLFSLVLTYTLAVVSMFVAATDSKTPDGTGKWAAPPQSSISQSENAGSTQPNN